MRALLAALPLDDVRVAAGPATTQVVTVDHTDGRIGYGGVVAGDRRVQDNASPHHHGYRNQRRGGFRWWLPASDPDSSARLTDHRRPYEWSIVTGGNLGQVRHRGSGIFLHVNGRGATAGCVSAPRPFLRALVRRLDPAAAPVIAVGR